jgi:hypothetical protein
MSLDDIDTLVNRPPSRDASRELVGELTVAVHDGATGRP